MKINSFSHGIIDTDKLPDAQAEVVEESERFKKFIRDRHGEEFIWMRVPGKMTWASVHLDSIESILGVVKALDMSIRSVTQGRMGVAFLPTEIIKLIEEHSKEDPDKT
jgi:hypothetical protein